MLALLYEYNLQLMAICVKNRLRLIIRAEKSEKIDWESRIGSKDMAESLKKRQGYDLIAEKAEKIWQNNGKRGKNRAE